MNYYPVTDKPFHILSYVAYHRIEKNDIENYTRGKKIFSTSSQLKAINTQKFAQHKIETATIDQVLLLIENVYITEISKYGVENAEFNQYVKNLEKEILRNFEEYLINECIF